MWIFFPVGDLLDIYPVMGEVPPLYWINKLFSLLAVSFLWQFDSIQVNYHILGGKWMSVILTGSLVKSDNGEALFVARKECMDRHCRPKLPERPVYML